MHLIFKVLTRPNLSGSRPNQTPGLLSVSAQELQTPISEADPKIATKNDQVSQQLTVFGIHNWGLQVVRKKMGLIYIQCIKRTPRADPKLTHSRPQADANF